MPRSKPSKTEKEKRRAERMARKRERARQEILDAAAEVLADRGVNSFTLEEVARTLGVTKPAIYYYFKSKLDLFQSIIAASVRAEIDVLCDAVDAAETGAEALGNVIRAFVTHHRANLRAFRLVYLHGQIVQSADVTFDSESVKELVHPHTTRFYDLLEAKLLADRERGELAEDCHPRRLAVDAHAAALGLMTMIGITEAANDPMKHSDDVLVDELVRTFVAGARR